VVTEINPAVLRRSPGESRQYLATNTAENLPANAEYQEPMLTPDFLQSLDFSFIPPARLDVKIGAPVILMRNLDADRGLCNGARLTVVRMAPNTIELKILTGEHAGQKRFIPPIKLTSHSEDFPFLITRLQFSIRLCFSMTINRSQGQSLRIVGVDLRAQVFCNGQFYVAMLRDTDVSLFYHSNQPTGKCGIL
jgi:hypothetical protein